MKDFIVGVVSHRGLHPLTATSIEFAHQELGNRFLVKYDSGDAWLDRLRSVAITQFYTHEWADYFIFLDDDIVFSPNHLLKIYEDLKAGYRLVGGLYPTRNGSQLSSYGGGEDGGILLDGAIKDIKWLATGFMGIAKSLLKDMVEKLNLPLLHKGMWCECYPFFIFKNDETMLFSEDWEFCEKAKKVGDRIYADTSVLLGHVGERVMTVKDVIENTEKILAAKATTEVIPSRKTKGTVKK